MTAHRPTAGSSAAAHGMPCLPTTLDELVRAVQARLGLACELRCDAEAIPQRLLQSHRRSKRRGAWQAPTVHGVGLGPSLPHLHHEWARPYHITTAPTLPHPHGDWAFPFGVATPHAPRSHLLREWAHPAPRLHQNSARPATSAPGFWPASPSPNTDPVPFLGWRRCGVVPFAAGVASRVRRCVGSNLRPYRRPRR